MISIPKNLLVSFGGDFYIGTSPDYPREYKPIEGVQHQFLGNIFLYIMVQKRDYYLEMSNVVFCRVHFTLSGLWIIHSRKQKLWEHSKRVEQIRETETAKQRKMRYDQFDNYVRFVLGSKND